ncbi:ribonuclease III [Suipraeoptans intestinalis]|uniref:ribonuclease III n=1 Tax=Suipraeoptans intestinalis TaxID=2606628 RepID=UPI0023F46594|nr:ribonuclease III [Suipraeoptans intestinalis]MDD7770558.1 ribonuclease III [Suipraeoptans intestinalis]
MDRLRTLEEKIGYGFKNPVYLRRALTHSSCVNESRLSKEECNERLEFLGDAVLELISSEFLFLKYRDLPEGSLTKTRASLVCEPSLAYCARQIDLGNFLCLGKGEEGSGGRERESIISDAMEALIGAIYLDGGLEKAREFIHRYILSGAENRELFLDSKSILQEMVQARLKQDITYQLLTEDGPDHDKVFEVAVFVGDTAWGKGSGKTKKRAEQEAAYDAVLRLREK